MASWSELLKQLKQHSQNPENFNLADKLHQELQKISKLRNPNTIIFYASAFLQKNTGDPSEISISREDINGFMNAIHEADTQKGLTLILHTPGGDPNAVESIVEYLHAKFDYIEVIVPYLAMSGGSMISLASDLLLLGRQSQLGPIDPQLLIGNKFHSARAIQEGFSKAKEDIKNDIKFAHLWAPILQSMGPALMIEATKALSYSKELVIDWMKKRMFNQEEMKEKEQTINNIAEYFNAEKTKKNGNVYVHGQRIGIEKLIELGVKVEYLEASQELQNAVLTAYHLMTLIFENGSALKFINTNANKGWIKNQPTLIPVHQVPAPGQ